ncbi:hypothetical protein NEILACOT_03471 [Neisseria lactamica ATCC 23970]|uniref:Uncharacterized protein n=1 Tax=Neisseria lactamica ATCC 23970 TaxID=546265 RepID=D0W7H2_NEILA|nr:hypothetical protein NEILACOT_03471 [Neisseria lactamica ATCC 23970]
MSSNTTHRYTFCPFIFFTICLTCPKNKANFPASRQTSGYPAP